MIYVLLLILFALFVLIGAVRRLTRETKAMTGALRTLSDQQRGTPRDYAAYEARPLPLREGNRRVVKGPGIKPEDVT